METHSTFIQIKFVGKHKDKQKIKIEYSKKIWERDKQKRNT